MTVRVKVMVRIQGDTKKLFACKIVSGVFSVFSSGGFFSGEGYSPISMRKWRKDPSAMGDFLQEFSVGFFAGFLWGVFCRESSPGNFICGIRGFSSWEVFLRQSNLFVITISQQHSGKLSLNTIWNL